MIPIAISDIKRCFLTLALFHFGEFLEVGGEELGTADVIPDVDLLVLRVGAVVGSSHRQQHNVLPGRFLKGERDGNRTTFAG